MRWRLSIKNQKKLNLGRSKLPFIDSFLKHSVGLRVHKKRYKTSTKWRSILQSLIRRSNKLSLNSILMSFRKSLLNTNSWKTMRTTLWNFLRSGWTVLRSIFTSKFAINTENLPNSSGTSFSKSSPPRLKKMTQVNLSEKFPAWINCIKKKILPWQPCRRQLQNKSTNLIPRQSRPNSKWKT